MLVNADAPDGFEYTDDELREIAAEGCFCSEGEGQCDSCIAGAMLTERKRVSEVREEAANLPEEPDVAF